MQLLDLPDCMLEQVLEFLSYDEIAKQRIVSQCFFKSNYLVNANGKHNIIMELKTMATRMPIQINGKLVVCVHLKEIIDFDKFC